MCSNPLEKNSIHAAISPPLKPRCCRGLALWMMAEARGFTQDVKWQNTGQLVTECRRLSHFYWVLQTLIVKWERGVSEEAHRCAEAASNFIVFSPFLWLRRWGGAAPLWLSGVTWQQVIQPRVMNDTPGEWESRRETNRFSCNSPGARPRRPSPEFYTRVSSNRKKTPQRELKRTCGQTGVRLVFILSFLALCSEAASTSCVCDPFSFLGFLDPLPVSDERLGLFFLFLCLCTSSFDTTAFN